MGASARFPPKFEAMQNQIAVSRVIKNARCAISYTAGIFFNFCFSMNTVRPANIATRVRHPTCSAHPAKAATQLR